MKQAFEAATKAYETVKKSVQEKWEGFKKKFEGTKTEMSREVMDAKSPEDLIALGKKLQEQGEALKAEEEGVKAEETSEEEKHKQEEGEIITEAHGEALEMNKDFDENKAAEQAEAERIAAEEQATHEEYKKTSEVSDQARIEELRAKLNGEVGKEQAEKSPEEKMDDFIAKFKKIGAEHGSYALAFNTMRDDKSIDFDNNDEMVKRFVKGMGSVDAVGVLNNLGKEKSYSKNTVLEVINSMPESSANDFYRGGYNELRILAMRAGLEKDRDVKDAIVKKNPNMESLL